MSLMDGKVFNERYFLKGPQPQTFIKEGNYFICLIETFETITLPTTFLYC